MPDPLALSLDKLDAVVRSLNGETLKAEDEATFLKATVEAVPLLVAEPESGTIVYATQACERLFGYVTRHVLVGRIVESLMPEANRAIHPGHRAGFALLPKERTMGEGQPLPALRADGREFQAWIGLSSFMFRGVMCAVVTFTRADDLLGLTPCPDTPP